ncbi:MAG: hypothetical protein ACRELB_03450 [Polyangiaceae bacterium]
MRLALSLATAVAAALALVAVASCGSSSNGASGFEAGAPEGATTDGSHDGSDGGAGLDSGGGDVISFGDVTAPKEAGPVSSLSLEQVWFLTGEATGTNKNFFVDFRKPGTPVVTCGASVPAATGDEGTAVFTDPTTGQLLFYTDGITVYDGWDDMPLANGNGLLGQPSSTEPALITPKYGGDGGTFYVFSDNYTDDTSATGDIYYSTIDLNQGAHGTVTAKNTHLFTGNVGEALDMLPHANGNDFWVLAYDGADKVDAFLVSASGVSSTPVVSSTGLTGTVLRSAINHSYDYDHVVLAMNFGTSGQIATSDFDRSTGVLSNVKTVVTGDLGYHASYSGQGSKLYYVRGTQGWEGVAYQYDLVTGTETMLGGTGLAAAKLAPDGKVYYVGYSKTALTVVNNPDAPGASAGFVVDALPLGGCAAAFGVPNQTAAYLSYLPPTAQ